MASFARWTPAKPAIVPMEEPERQGAAVDGTEAARLDALTRTGILDTDPEQRFQRVVNLARVLFDAPGAAISFVDRDRQWLKARSGMNLSPETPRETSFCSHAIEGSSVFVVPDAREDERFRDNPLVQGPPHIRFYAGAPLRGRDGQSLGALCVLSPEPRASFSSEDQRRLEVLAGIVINEMELRQHLRNSADSAKADMLSQLDEAQCRVRNKLDFSNLLLEIQSGKLSVEALSALAIAAWEQHIEADTVLASSIRSLRTRMSPAEYKSLLKSMPGFGMVA